MGFQSRLFQDNFELYNDLIGLFNFYNVPFDGYVFDRIVNVLLVKLVDECFYDNFLFNDLANFDLYDLHDLCFKYYKKGMSVFLGEDVYYVEDSYLDKNSIGVKYFVNHPFAFVEVFNKDSFQYNYHVLFKVLNLFKDLRLSESNSFLGDLFENLLNNTFKQGNGQFFTPLPVVRFIIKSLPIITDGCMCDYSCGSGHFLTEYYNSDNTGGIIGVELDSRLSKTTMISSATISENIKVIQGNGLDNPILKEGVFDRVLANPPYKVKGFCEHLKNEVFTDYELHDTVSNKTTYSNIELFFIEQAIKLLKPYGLATIILPVSVLTNTTRTYDKIRKLIIKYCFIECIVELPSGTFHHTGANTIILYLRKKQDNHMMQDSEVLLVNCEDKEKFLGYEYSKRKGHTGIKYYNANNLDDIQTILYNPHKQHDPLKLNTVIYNHLTHKKTKNNNIKYCNIEYKKIDEIFYDGTINLTKPAQLESDYTLYKLGEICDIRIGGTPSRQKMTYYNPNGNLWVTIKDLNNSIILDTQEKITNEAIKNSNVKLIPKGTTLISFKLTIGKTGITSTEVYTNESIAGLIPYNPQEVLNEYLFYLFNTNILTNHIPKSKSYGATLNLNYLKNKITIPVPPINTQKKIIKECKNIHNEYNKVRMSIEEYHDLISKIFMESRVIKSPTKS